MLSDLRRPFGIVGMGRSGQSVARLLGSLNMKPKDFATFDDVKGRAQFNNSTEFLQTIQPNTLIVSPGYPLDTDWLTLAKNKGVKIINELTLASYFLSQEKLIGITGSVGKSTVAALLAEGAKSVDQNAFLGGNFGTPLCDYISEVIEKTRERSSWIILELSSYHLEGIENLSFEFGGITYLTENHLERYSSKEIYYKTKWNLLSLTKKNLFLNRNGGDLYDYAQEHWDDKIIFTHKSSDILKNDNLIDSFLFGDHNQDNLALAAHIAHFCQWGAEALSAMKQYRGLPHRLEHFGDFKGVRFINDSKSTAVQSVMAALSSTLPHLPKNNRLHLLVGGKDKNLPWEDLSSLKTKENLSFYFFGECASVASLKSGLNGKKYLNLKDATTDAFLQSKSGDIVLLSPGGTSLDEFKNFEERGNYFKNLIPKL